MDFTDKVTIIITTFNRYAFLLRLLKFYESYRLKFRIVVLDSSSDTLVQEDLRELLSLENISWRKFDSDIFVVQKIAQGLKDIVTPYCVLCADDDFITPYGIEESIHFLDEHSDYALAHGVYISHHVSRGKSFCWIPAYIDQVRIDSDSPMERLKYHLANYDGCTFYAVHRQEILRLMFEEATEYTSDWGLAEIFPSALSVLYGKAMKLPVFYSSRERSDFEPFDRNYANNMYSDEKCERAIDGLAKHIVALEGVDDEFAGEFARESLKVFVGHQNEKVSKDANRESIKKVLDLVHLRASALAIRYRIGLARLQKSKRYRWQVHIVRLDFHGDFSRIKNMVLQYPANDGSLNRIRETYMKKNVTGRIG